MEDSSKRILNTLRGDITCENKDIHNQIDPIRRFHNHDGYEIFLMLNGDLNFGTEKSAKRLERGDLVLIRPYEFHYGELQNFEIYDRTVINFRDSFMKSMSTPDTDLSACFHRISGSGLNLFHLNEEEISHFLSCSRPLEQALTRKHFGDDVLTDALLRQLLVMLNRLTIREQVPEYTAVMPDLVAASLSYIEQHLTEDITREALEHHILHDGAYISRCFKKATGTPLQQFIIAKRIALAQKYLREGEAPGDVCYMTGFHNYSNFSRTFSKHAGMSPQQYQMANR